MVSPYGIVEISGDRLVSFKEKPVLDYYINGGVYFSKEEIDFGDFDVGDIEKTVFPMYAKNNQLVYYQEDGLFWMAIDTSKELEEIQKEYQNRNDKPWGYEKVLINTEKYLTKELFIREGYQTSFITIPRRMKPCTILSGAGYIEFEDQKKYFAKNDTIRIKPLENHSIVAMKTPFSTKYQHHTQMTLLESEIIIGYVKISYYGFSNKSKLVDEIPNFF
jgi:mannose-6-phosphate isomerase-like protein (cupin superfamily)